MAPQPVKNPPAPGSVEHTRKITASKVAAILGIDPYKTTGELWMEMSGLAAKPELDDTTVDMFGWGHDAEASLAKFWKRQNDGWQLNVDGEIAYEDKDLPFPNLATLDRRARRGRSFHRLEMKTSVSSKKWGDIGDALPSDVLAQTIFQAGVSGIATGSVVALVAYDKPMIPRIYEAPANKDVFDGIVDVCHEFYKSLGNHEPPMPDPELIDALTTARVVAPEDGEVSAPEELVDAYKHTAAVLADAQAAHEQSKQALLDFLGDRKTLRWQGKILASPTKGRFAKSRIPEAARHLLMDPDVQTPAFDAKKFAKKYPNITAAATSDDTITIRDRALQ